MITYEEVFMITYELDDNCLIINNTLNEVRNRVTEHGHEESKKF